MLLGIDARTVIGVLEEMALLELCATPWHRRSILHGECYLRWYEDRVSEEATLMRKPFMFACRGHIKGDFPAGKGWSVDGRIPANPGVWITPRDAAIGFTPGSTL